MTNEIKKLPNLLSISRILLTPIIVTLIFLGGHYTTTALIIFTIAAITDYLDGYLARKYNMQTRLGAFLDPFADKILVPTTLLAFYLIGTIPLWMLLVIVLRDILITGMRMAAEYKGHHFKTSRTAKWKTTMQFIAIYALFFYVMLVSMQPWLPAAATINFCDNHYILPIIMYTIVIATVWTGVEYVWKQYE